MGKYTKEEIAVRRRAGYEKRLEARNQQIAEREKQEWDALTKEEQALRRENQELSERITETYIQARMVRKAAAVEVERILLVRKRIWEERGPVLVRLAELEAERLKGKE
jgi:regulator of replication initiation timing